MDNEKQGWEDFCDRFIDASWFDYGRAKTLVAMQLAHIRALFIVFTSG
jgi:hypothetical protein